MLKDLTNCMIYKISYVCLLISRCQPMSLIKHADLYATRDFNFLGLFILNLQHVEMCWIHMTIINLARFLLLKPGCWDCLLIGGIIPTKPGWLHLLEMPSRRMIFFFFILHSRCTIPATQHSLTLFPNT